MESEQKVVDQQGLSHDQLTFRSYAERPDAEGVAAVVNRSFAADGIDNRTTGEELDHFYKNFKGLDPASDIRLAWHADQVVGESYLLTLNELDGPRVYLHHTYLDPDWRPVALAPLTHWAEARAAAIEAAADRDGPALLRCSVTEGEVELRSLIEAHGYQAERYFYFMVRPTLDDLPDLPAPDGLEIRPVAEDHWRPIWLAKEEAFRDHWGHREESEEDFQRLITDPIQDPALWQVAWDGDQVAGMVLNFIDRDENEAMGRLRGYTEDIGVRRPWRRRGLASYLIAESLRLLKDQGMQEAALTVDADNPSGALTLYERLGYQVVRRSFAYSKPLVR